MTYKHINALLFASLILIILPLRMSAQGVAPEVNTNAGGACSTVLSRFSTLVRPLISSTSVRAGEPVIIPVSLQNDTGTPLSSVRLLVKVSMLGKSPRLVFLQVDPKRYSLSSGEFATTSITWNTLRTEATGDYRVDVFAVPTINYINARLASDVPALASANVHVSEGRGSTIISFVKDQTAVNGVKYNSTLPVRLDENEQGRVSVTVHNSGKQSLPILVNWKVYPYQQIEEGALLLATTSTVLLPASASRSVELPVPQKPSMRYFAIAEVVENGQYTLLPINFNRAAREPVPISMYGVIPESTLDGAFDMRGGEKYTLFACPMGLSVLTPTTITLEVQDEFGRTILASSTTNGINEPALPFELSFVPSADIPNSKIILTTSAGGITEHSTILITCGGKTGRACSTRSVAPVPFDMSPLIIPIGAVILAFIGSVLWFRARKHSKHEKTTHK